jgi:long-subunit fatty acid transport protein
MAPPWTQFFQITIILSMALLLFALSAHAQQIEFSSSMNPVGSGARATGMGGAFIAVADDVTAASWNPAGLIHLEKPEISIVYSYYNRNQSYSSEAHPELSGTNHNMDINGVNYASVAVPFNLLNRNMILTFNYQRLYDMNKRVHFNFNWDLKNGDYLRDSINFRQDGYLGAFSPAFAVQITPELYFGTTVNIWNDALGTCNWKNSYSSSGTGSFASQPFTENVTWANKYTFKGVNANLGLLYTFNGKYSFGAVYKTPFAASVNKETTFRVENNFLTSPANSGLTGKTTTEEITIDMPASYGAGFAYRHSDRLSFALDIYRTQWSDFSVTDSSGKKTNPITTTSLNQGKAKDTTQVRGGAEYLLIGDKTVIPLRGGLFYDPEPGRTGVDDFYGLSVGSGIAIDNYAFDISYQYRWGDRVSGDIPQSGVSSDIHQHTIMMSLIYHF